MSFQERRTLVSLITMLLVTAAYAILMAGRYPQADAYSIEIFRYWGGFVVGLIIVSIIARIITAIAFVILHTVLTQTVEPDLMDERDRLIELKALRAALYVFSVGFLLAMGGLIVDLPPGAMFIILIGAGVLSEVVSETLTIIYYRRGV